MSFDRGRKPGGSTRVQMSRAASAPGKRTRAGALDGPRSASAQKAVESLAPNVGLTAADVDVHADEAGDARAAAHGTKAVTEGRDIFLASTVDPTSSEGQQVLAHELVHVAQQRGASAGGGAKGVAGDPYEQEAHELGTAAAAGASVSPQLATGQTMAQGYGTPEHEGFGDNVHSVLDSATATDDPTTGTCREATFGGVPDARLDAQQKLEGDGFDKLQPAETSPLDDDLDGQVDEGPKPDYSDAYKKPAPVPGQSQTGGLGKVADVRNNLRDDPSHGAVAVPRLQEMLDRDAFFRERGRNLTIPLRSYRMMTDDAGAFLAMQTDPATKQAIRYDVPVSPGDMTAMNGDLYGSMENLRKAPLDEVVGIQKIMDDEAAWEQRALAHEKDPAKNPEPGDEPDTNANWEKATKARAQPIYGAGEELGAAGSVTGAGSDAYLALANDNGAHFGEETAAKNTLELTVKAGNLETIAAAPQGNAARAGNESAWMSGHARALLLAKESFALKSDAAADEPSAAGSHAYTDHYGHDTDVPPTGLVKPETGNKLAPAAVGANGQPLKRSSGEVTVASKLNDAYVENAGADHFLTDGFAAGHQIVRSVMGKVADDYIAKKGGLDGFLEFIVMKLQQGALDEKEEPTGPMAKQFWNVSRKHPDAARGDSFWLNKHGPLVWLGIGGPGLKQKLQEKLEKDPSVLRSILTKMVHDYYNQHGMIVQNKKGMTFEIFGDGNADKAPQAMQIIEIAVLESRNQITEMATKGATGGLMDVWDYTPDFDKTAFTETSAPQVLEFALADGDRLWRLAAPSFELNDSGGENPQEKSAVNEVEKSVAGGRGAPADIGTPPAQSWLKQRQAYIAQQLATYPQAGKDDDDGITARTADGVSLPDVRREPGDDYDPGYQ